MIRNDKEAAPALERLTSAIPGFDTILSGGLFKGGVYLLQGSPGSGKTILANQFCFGHVASGGRAVYVTLLAESHARMLQHMRQLDFFDESVIPDSLYYVSAFSALESEGLKGLVAMLRREMRSQRPNLVVLDGFISAAESAESGRELKKFIHEVQTIASLHECTFLLLSSGIIERQRAEHTMVDGLIDLEDRLFDLRSERAIQIRKFRGCDPMRGKHNFQITDSGVSIYPRLEASFGHTASAHYVSGFVSSGSPDVDRLITAGGLPTASVSVVVGSTGIGKTSFGLQFLSGSSVEQPGLLFGFFETPDQLLAKADALALPLRSLCGNGSVDIIWHPQAEHMLDELAHRLLAEVEARGVRRLVIDGVAGFFESATSPERIGRFLACLANELRRREVTVVMTLETREVTGGTVPTPYGISAIVDNLFFLRFVEAEGEIKRLISILKIRNSGFDSGVHVYAIGEQGIRVDGRYTAGGDVLPKAAAVPDKMRGGEESAGKP